MEGNYTAEEVDAMCREILKCVSEIYPRVDGAFHEGGDTLSVAFHKGRDYTQWKIPMFHKGITQERKIGYVDGLEYITLGKPEVQWNPTAVPFTTSIN